MRRLAYAESTGAAGRFAGRAFRTASSSSGSIADVRRDRSVFFFFQAEDGIRDYKVTGVQTCALPIFPGEEAQLRREPLELARRVHDDHVQPPLGARGFGKRQCRGAAVQLMPAQTDRKSVV